MRDDVIYIPGGEHVVVCENDLDGLTIRQDGEDGEQFIGVTVDQARRVAAALLHLAEVVDREQKLDAAEVAKEREAQWNSRN